MPATRLLKNAALYQGTHNRYDATTSQIVTTTSTGEQLVHNTLSTQDAVAIRDGLLKAHPLPAPAPSSCLLGMNGTPDWPSMITKGCQLVNPKLVRLDMARMGSAALQDAAIRAVLAQGATPLVLFSTWQGTSVPSQIRSFVDRYGPCLIELGNETSYSYQSGSSVATLKANAAAYAQQVKATKAALEGTTARLLVQADGALWAGSTWVDTMYATVPDLHVGIGGWTFHPYTAGREVEQGQQLVDATAKHGAPKTTPLYVTEWGTSSDDGRQLTPKETATGTIYGHPANQTYEQAAGVVTNVHGTLTTAFPQLAAFCVFESIDEAGPGATKNWGAYFGFMLRGKNQAGVSVEGQPKPYYTDAVKALGA